jgi:hypothetical protein
MRIKISHIVLLLTGFMILSSKSCEPDTFPNGEADLQANQDSLLREIKNQFESDYLHDEQLRIYGERAKQKLFDLADLLTLYSNKNMDTLFRQQVNTMITRLFLNSDAEMPLSFTQIIPEEKTKSHITHFLQQVNAASYTSIRFTVYDIKTIEPFHINSMERYTGMLGCRFRIAYMAENDTLLLKETSNRVSIIAAQTEKQFGDSAYNRVWQVFLDGIK